MMSDEPHQPTVLITQITGQVLIIPRLLRLRDAPAYLGMDRHYFDATVRPTVQLIRIGKQGLAVDRLDLDAWVVHTKQCSDPPAANHRRNPTWQRKESQVSTNVRGSGTLTKKSSAAAFAKALKLTRSRKLSSS